MKEGHMALKTDPGALGPAFLDSTWSIWNTPLRKIQIY